MSSKINKNIRETVKFRHTKKSNPKNAVATRKVESDESDSSDAILSDDGDRWKDAKCRQPSDLTPDYHSIQKLVKYVKAGNTTATMVSLCCLKDYDLTIPINQLVRNNFSSSFSA